MIKLKNILNEQFPELLTQNQTEDKIIGKLHDILDKELNRASESDVSGLLKKIIDPNDLKELVIDKLKPIRNHFFNRYSRCYQWDQARDEKIIEATLENIAKIFLLKINNLGALKVGAIKSYMFVIGYDKENLAQVIESNINSYEFQRIVKSAVTTINSIIRVMRLITKTNVYVPKCRGVDKSNTPEDTYPHARSRSIAKNIINNYTPLYKDAIIKKFS